MNLKKIIIVFYLFYCCGIYPAYAGEPSLERQSELKHLLLHDCGSCHGMTLKGGLGSALTPDVLSNKTEELLFQTIKNGRLDTPMPPWKDILSDADIQWLVTTLKKGIDQ